MTTSTSTSTLLKPPPARTDSRYDNTLATRACTLLAATEIAAQFGGPVADGVPVAPYCWWKIGANAFFSLTVFDPRPLASFRANGGLVVAEVPDLGERAFFASNKTLFVGFGGATYVLQFERGAEWVDSNRPRLVALARLLLDRLGWVPPPDPLPGTELSEGTELTEPLPPTTTTTITTRLRLPVLLPPPPLARPTGPIDVLRPLGPEAPLRLWAGGDSFASGPAWAVGEASRATGVVVTDTEFQVGTGLARPDFFDWTSHLAAVADARDPEVMILMFGANDIQPLDVPFLGLVPHGDPRWFDEYRRRVADIMDILAVRGRRVVWVGLPPMEDPTYSAEMAVLNEIYAAEANRRRPWVSYVDTWTAFSPPGAPGEFASELPDADGTPQRVRIDDIHLNQHGSVVLAAALLDHLRLFTQLPPR